MEVDENSSHVVRTDTIVCVWCQDITKHCLDWLGQNFLISVRLNTIDFLSQSFNTLFVRKTIPNSIAGQHDELIILVPVSFCHVWETCHSLLLWRQPSLILELEVTEGSTKCKISINSRLRYKMVGFLNSSLFLLVVWFMILTQTNGSLARFETSSAITSISTEDLCRSNKNNAGCASCIISIIFCFHFSVKVEESIFECFFILLIFEFLKSFKDRLKSLVSKFSYFFSTVAIEDSKEHALFS